MRFHNLELIWNIFFNQNANLLKLFSLNSLHAGCNLAGQIIKLLKIIKESFSEMNKASSSRSLSIL